MFLSVVVAGTHEPCWVTSETLLQNMQETNLPPCPTSSSSIVCSELHGSPEDISHLQQHCKVTHIFVFSFGAQSREGGVRAIV